MENPGVGHAYRVMQDLARLSPEELEAVAHHMERIYQRALIMGTEKFRAKIESIANNFKESAPESRRYTKAREALRVEYHLPEEYASIILERVENHKHLLYFREDQL